jgi:hypothetical protein
VDAGEPANVPASDVHYGIRMRIRDQGSAGAGTDAGTCRHIAINNTHYHNTHNNLWTTHWNQASTFCFALRWRFIT